MELLALSNYNKWFPALQRNMFNPSLSSDYFSCVCLLSHNSNWYTLFLTNSSFDNAHTIESTASIVIAQHCFL